MRRGNLLAVLAILILVGCATKTPFREMVGYVPPTSLPSQPKRTMVQDPPHRVWNRLIAFLQTSDFEIDHADGDQRLIVARYSGSPERYVDCGSIVIHENGALSEIPGAAEEITLNARLDDQPVVLKRGVSLESRIIIRLEEQNLGTVVSTDTTYVVTKTVDMKPLPGVKTETSHEVISFSAGKRAEFAKGTACQPNGALDVAVLRTLPHVVGSNEIARADLPVDRVGEEEVGSTDQSKGKDTGYWIDPDRVIAGRSEDEQLDAAILPKNPIAD